MSKFNSIMSSFSSGMVSKKFNGRTDLEVYKSAVEEMINMDPTSEGGASTRMGFDFLRYVTDTEFAESELDNVTNFQLIPIRYSNGDSYLFVVSFGTRIGNKEIIFRYYKYENNFFTYISNISVSSLPSTITNVLPFSYAYIGDALILATSQLAPRILYRSKDLTTFYLIPLDTYPLVSEQFGANYTYNVNSLIKYLAYPTTDTNVNDKVLLTWTLNEGSQYTIRFSTGAADIAGVFDQNLSTYFVVSDATRTMVFKTIPNSYAAAETTKMEATLIYFSGNTANNQSQYWWRSAWDNIIGYPKSVSFSNNRLVFAGTSKFPSSLWFSNSQTFWRFHNIKFKEDKTSDTSGYGTNLDFGEKTSAFVALQGQSGEFADIRWIANGPKGLYIGTSAGVEIMTSGNNGALALDNVFSVMVSQEGCASIQPVSLSGSLIYVGKNLKKINMITDQGSIELSMFNRDLINSYDSIKSVTVNESRSQLIIVTEYAKIHSLIFNRAENKWGFSRYDLGVTSSLVELVNTPNRDVVTPLVLCKYPDKNGTFKYALSAQIEDYASSTKTRDLMAIDLKAVLAPETKTITLPDQYKNGIDDLVIYGEASDHKWYYEVFKGGTYTNTVTTQNLYDQGRASIGFLFTQKIKTLDLNFGGSGDNTAISMIKRIDAVGFRYWNSQNFDFGMAEDTTLQRVELGDKEAIDTYSGIIEKKLQASPSRENHFVIEVNEPYNLYISALVFKGLTME